MSASTATRQLDTKDLEQKVKAMYRAVAMQPNGEFHFEMGRPLTDRLGYPAAELDAIPGEAIDSFAGVGYYFDLAQLKSGERVVDLGSGSGTDSFIAALHVGPAGKIIGVDMTDEQLAKSERLRRAAGIGHIAFRKSYIEATGLPAGEADAVISNGVINLAADKDAVFKEAVRLLKPGGRLALADIVTDVQLPPSITCDATLWAACIGGAMQIEKYLGAIEAAGLKVRGMKDNAQYRFISDNAQGATRKFGVKSVSLVAYKP
jgi:arsenite methyltransferase